MAAKKRRKKTSSAKKRTSKRSGKKRSRKKTAAKKPKRRRARSGTKRISIIPLGTLGDIRKTARRTGQSVGDVILDAMKKGAPRGTAKKRDISRIVTAQLLLPR